MKKHLSEMRMYVTKKMCDMMDSCYEYNGVSSRNFDELKILGLCIIRTVSDLALVIKCLTGDDDPVLDVRVDDEKNEGNVTIITADGTKKLDKKGLKDA